MSLFFRRLSKANALHDGLLIILSAMNQAINERVDGLLSIRGFLDARLLSMNEMFENVLSERLRAARRVVIKLGTSIITGLDGQLATEQVQPLVRSICRTQECRAPSRAGLFGRSRTWSRTTGFATRSGE